MARYQTAPQPQSMYQDGGLDGFTHSRCVQRRISDPTDAASAFNDSANNEICLVAVPTETMCCCSPHVNIPSGYHVLHQRWYKNEGKLEPGVKWCWPFWMRVSHVVNPATISYSAPSQQAGPAHAPPRCSHPPSPCPSHPMPTRGGRCRLPTT